MNNLLKTLIAILAIINFSWIAKADYPEKPITMVIPFGPGGSHDLNARVFTSIIPQYLGNAIIVKLVPGASGQTGTAMELKQNQMVILFCSLIIMWINFSIM